MVKWCTFSSFQGDYGYLLVQHLMICFRKLWMHEEEAYSHAHHIIIAVTETTIGQFKKWIQSLHCISYSYAYISQNTIPVCDYDTPEREGISRSNTVRARVTNWIQAFEGLRSGWVVILHCVPHLNRWARLFLLVSNLDTCPPPWPPQLLCLYSFPLPRLHPILCLLLFLLWPLPMFQGLIPTLHFGSNIFFLQPVLRCQGFLLPQRWERAGQGTIPLLWPHHPFDSASLRVLYPGFLRILPPLVAPQMRLVTQTRSREPWQWLKKSQSYTIHLWANITLEDRILHLHKLCWVFHKAQDQFFKNSMSHI